MQLSASKLQELETVLSTMVAPLDHDLEEEWLGEINRRVTRFFVADGGLSLVPSGGAELAFSFLGADRETARTFREIAVGAEDGLLRRYPGLDRMMRRLAAGGVQVWTPESAERVTGVRIDDIAFTHEIAIPAGVMHQANLVVPAGGGMAQIAFYHLSPERDPFGDDRIPLLHLLRPAFRSGVDALRTFRRHRDALAAQLDGMPTAVLAFDLRGRPLYQNRAASALFADERYSALQEEAEAMAGTLNALRRRRRKSGPPSPRLPEQRELRCGGVRFRLSSSFLPSGLLDRDWTTLVSVERLTLALPAVEMICEHTGLTPRQAEVACLIAEDLSSAAIAERLGISVHTVRRHAERILPRLGVRSRKGVAARLLSIGHSPDV